MRRYIFITAHPNGLMLSADGEIVTSQTVQHFCQRTGYTILSAGFERDYWHIVLQAPDAPRTVNVPPMGVFVGATDAYEQVIG